MIEINRAVLCMKNIKYEPLAVHVTYIIIEIIYCKLLDTNTELTSYAVILLLLFQFTDISLIFCSICIVTSLMIIGKKL